MIMFGNCMENGFEDFRFDRLSERLSGHRTLSLSKVVLLNLS